MTLFVIRGAYVYTIAGRSQNAQFIASLKYCLIIIFRIHEFYSFTFGGYPVHGDAEHKLH